ncbi:hypothetical protein ACU61A_39145 [Pseudonocardia sichuanensis]
MHEWSEFTPAEQAIRPTGDLWLGSFRRWMTFDATELCTRDNVRHGAANLFVVLNAATDEI